MNIIENVINEGKTAIMLVPEISLTPQLVNIFRKRFGKTIAILHSGLSDGEKYDEWRKINRSEVSIVIGARSAVFSPLKNIGLIIMDEEQSTSFKQDNNPRYHALDVAIWRMKKAQGKVLLGSATPSLDTYARSMKGVYGLVKLDKRVNGKNLPKVEIIDMNDEVKQGNTMFSNLLKLKIEEHISQGNQVILLHNRRGYSSFISCKNSTL